MTVGFHAPLPPVRSGVADYAEALLAAMPGPCRANADGDIDVYHLGNNQLHAAIYKRALARPGVAVLHDAVLHHFHLGALTQAEYVEEFVYNYGAWYRGMAEELWRGRSRSAADARYFRWPMLRRIVERSRAVIVHNAGAARMVRTAVPAARVEIVPHLHLPMPPVDAVSVERWRAAHGMLPSHTTFGLLGYLRESKRVLPVLRVFQRLRALRLDVHIILAGEIGSTDLQRAVEPWLGVPGLVRLGHLASAEFAQLASACDVGVNLRYPAAGESSGITTRLMSLGRPVIVTDSEENNLLPPAACPRVPHGLAEEESLAAVMLWLADSPVRREQCGAVAAEYVRREQAAEAVARRYWQILESV